MLCGEDHGECILKVERLSSVLFVLGARRIEREEWAKYIVTCFGRIELASWWGGGESTRCSTNSPGSQSSQTGVLIGAMAPGDSRGEGMLDSIIWQQWYYSVLGR